MIKNNKQLSLFHVGLPHRPNQQTRPQRVRLVETGGVCVVELFQEVVLVELVRIHVQNLGVGEEHRH